MNTNFIHNDLRKDEYEKNSNIYNLRINSGDRNLLKERNPFSFRVRFNKHINNSTTVYNTPVINNTNEEDIIVKNDGAVIDSNYENIKSLKVNEIIAPRFVPSNTVGYEIKDLVANASTLTTSTIFLYSYNQTRVEYNSGFTVAGDIIYYVKIILKKDEFYLMSSDDLYKTFNTTTQSDREDYAPLYAVLKDNYITSELLLNDKIYSIDSVDEHFVTLNETIDFTSSSVYLPDYYKDNIYTALASTNFTLADSTITIVDDNLINYNYTPGSYINYNGSNFKITKTVVTYDFNGTEVVKQYPNIHMTDLDYSGNGLDRDNLPSYTTTFVFTGSWDFGTYAVGSSPYKFVLYEKGFIDLIDEKVVYLSLGSINHSKNTNSNIDLNQTVCSFFPSTQSYDYVYLSGDFKFHFNYRDLRNLKNLDFKLYYKNGNIIGNEYSELPLRVLNQDNKQLIINVFVQEVDKEF